VPNPPAPIKAAVRGANHLNRRRFNACDDHGSAKGISTCCSTCLGDMPIPNAASNRRSMPRKATSVLTGMEALPKLSVRSLLIES